MAVPLIRPAFTFGELAPGLYGRTDLARYHVGASTMRNLFVAYRGGAYSRAGTKFIGFSKQTGRNYPPRLVSFQFSVIQGLDLEFGNQYMRVISDGAFVTETPIPISNITRANPAVVSSSGIGAQSATPNTGAVIASYTPNDQVTLAGGTFSTAAILGITNTKLIGLQVNSPGTQGYVPTDTVNLTGGTQSTPAQLVVATTKVVSATVAAGGAAGTPGTQTVTGTTGTGTKFQASVTVSGGGAVTAVLSITVGGSYTVNPAVLANEPVTGAGLAGAQLSIKMGINTISIFAAGVFTANAAGGTFTQASTSGVGVGATFQFALMAPNAVSVVTPGVYTSFPPDPVAQASTTGTGSGVTFNVVSTSANPFVSGNWVYITGVNGMTQVNGETFVVGTVGAGTFTLKNVYGDNIDSSTFSAYTSGGTAARVFTLATPYAEADLKWLKWTQSADTMTICCLNQETSTEYQPQDLIRTSDTSWTFSPVVATPTVTPPPAATGTASSAGAANYEYVVTSVNDADGSESVASPIASILNAVNIAATAGTITVTWTAVAGVNEYNVYKATPGISAPVPAGTAFGYVGSAFGTQFNDSNIVSDFNQSPPLYRDPFARGQILRATPIAGGVGYTTITFVVTTGTGSGASFVPVIVGGSLVAIITVNSGKNYLAGDTIAVVGDGTGATAMLTIGAASGTYPSVPSYIQERRAYANTLNAPDTYFMSQPGAFRNFDVRKPTVDSDAITGSPWSFQVNGIQWMVPMPGGMVVFTGGGAWQLTGTGGSSLTPQPITPSTQQAQPQGVNGSHNHVPPIKIVDDIVFVQTSGAVIRELSYQIQSNIYSGGDLTINSTHLFFGYQVEEWAWCPEPLKVLWTVRSDGIMLSMTYLKQQEVLGWGRHDTQGLFKSVSSVIEQPVNALYLAVQRYPGGRTAYMIERMDDRNWSSVEDVWAVDCGLALAQPEPNATLTASSATGLGAVTGTTGLVGGSNYSASTTASVVDMGAFNNGEGPGTGAVPTVTIVAGIITAITFSVGNRGTNYVRPVIQINDPTNAGSGASATAVLDNSATFTASAGVFNIGDVGSVIRMGGGIAKITARNSATVVTAQITSPIVKLIPNSGGTPLPQVSGDWTLTAPTATISGLNHLIGATVTGLADGKKITPRVVAADGSVTLDAAASSVVVGLGFQAQLQSMYLDTGEPTVQGSRKKVAEVTCRLESSLGVKAGSNQPDGAVQNPPQIAPTWADLSDVEDKGLPAFGSDVIPLWTADSRLPVSGGFQTPGQVCLQQDSPWPMQVLAIVSEILPGDTPSLKAPQKQNRGNQGQQ